MGGTIVEFNFTWDQRVILLILYLNKGGITKQKLSTLLYLVYNEIKNIEPIDPLEDLDFYINMKTKTIEITTLDGYFDLNSILDNLLHVWEAIDFKTDYSMIYLTKEGYELVKTIMNDPKLKDEVDTIIKVVSLYKDLSEQGLINLILESLKHS